jgi:hypothetical protein
VIFNRPVLLEAQTSVNDIVVPVSFIVICKTSSKMGGNEANTGIGKFEADSTASLVASNSRETGL